LVEPSLLSIVIPVFNEEDSISVLVTRLDSLIVDLSQQINVEVWLVDDHSSDKTTQRLREVCHRNPAYHYLRLARNSGSHVAILAGLKFTKGDCAVFLAADLQDPPELIPQLLSKWREGCQIVWAVRQQRDGIAWLDRFTSNAFYRILNRFSSIQFPPQGSDFALIDRTIIDAVLQSIGATPSLGVEIARLGFNQAQIPYVKAQRQFGKSKWSLERKLRAFADALIATSYIPLRLMSYLGLITSVLGFLYAIVVIIVRIFTTTPIDGWAALMVVVLVFGGVQMVMLGVIGEYIWRTLEQSRNRPLYFVQELSTTIEADNMLPASVSKPEIEKMS
jgi:glycosyltransferase involved in cell wall biosynthesis